MECVRDAFLHEILGMQMDVKVNNTSEVVQLSSEQAIRIINSFSGEIFGCQAVNRLNRFIRAYNNVDMYGADAGVALRANALNLAEDVHGPDPLHSREEVEME